MMDNKRIEKAFREILIAIGEDPDREGLKETPSRVARMYEEIFSGLDTDPRRHMKVTFSEEQHDELVLVKDIPFYSMCEHHFVPFMGKAHVGYIPQDGSVVGLSKLARVVEEIAKRPQLQERITSEVANIIMEEIKPRGVIVVIEAEHLCMSMRGVKKPGSKTVTSAVRGIFKSNSKSRSEVMSLINNK
ncbi:MAG TPA: GTP cyclohydrolase I FolE [Clostridia bacterium]|nr:GTP cyclohydrolase I FolE [Clostridia bacterium]